MQLHVQFLNSKKTIANGRVMKQIDYYLPEQNQSSQGKNKISKSVYT